ncbi:MAG: hybrid sensor histidine kinase/response regulator [Granulosicoccus sp.]
MIDIDRKIYNEQIRLIYNQGTIPIAGATVCALVLTLFLWRHMPQMTLVFWLGTVSLSALLRLWCIYTYLKADQQTRERSIWGTLFWMGSLAAGIVWGALPLIFYSVYNTEFLLLISTIFAGMVTISAANGSNYLPSFLSFSVPLVLPLAISHLLSDVDSLALIGVLLIMFLATNFMLAVKSNRQNRDLISSQLENQKLVESLAEEKQIAERAMVAKSRFLAAASHDLRQPLHAMGLFLSALRTREKEPEKVRIIEDMSKSADALNSLFNSLLDVSRLDAEIIEFNPEHVLASRVFDALRAQFEQQVAEKNISLSIRADDHVLYSDVVLLERVLRNLLSNAVQYTGSGSISLVCTALADGSKLVTLADTGIGIPAEFAEDVFSEYYQLNNPARDRSKGLGLGLAIVKRLCELMDLPLEMESTEGKGTVFRVVVPGGDPLQIIQQAKPSSGIVADGRRVLVIDDELQVLQSMRHMLEGWGCEVLLAESARDALRVLALSDMIPDIIISDYRLADNLNGVDAVEAIRESCELSIPAIVVTGDTSPERLKQVKETGLQLLHKPVRPDELHDVMERILKDCDMPRILTLQELKPAANQ